MSNIAPIRSSVMCNVCVAIYIIRHLPLRLKRSSRSHLLIIYALDIFILNLKECIWSIEFRKPEGKQDYGDDAQNRQNLKAASTKQDLVRHLKRL